MYTIGMEEEYFVFDASTRRAVRRTRQEISQVRAQRQLGDRVMTEMLQSQIEVATPPCDSMAEARAHLAALPPRAGARRPPSASSASPPWAPSRSRSGRSRR